MDKETRNRIQRATQQARALLEEDYARQLGGTYDILESGQVAEAPGAHLESWQVPIRQKLVAAVRHRQTTGCRPAEAVAGCLREAAFTTLNRFVALKMLEARGLVQEALSKGEQSSGFREFTGLAPGLSGLPDHGYRLYLESLFDEIGQEVKVLFDRWDPASLLWPGHQAFQALLEILNQTDLAEVWKEDETIGWVYQYFNSDDERKKMRKESQAPRNSRELAVRNQFFTPRYVVEFLTDNTLGRTWYEMRQGQTTLVDRCQYLVRRRRPVFLKPGDVGPEPFVPTESSPGRDEAAMWTRPNPDLEEALDIHHYAQTMHGHLWARDVLGRDDSELFEEKAKTWQDSGKWEGTFEELRCCLFYLTRSEVRHGSHDPKEWDLEQIRPLYQEICRRWDLETEHIPFRAKKDPRDLKILDPACGSGHFLLYCFDLLIPIYEEAWADESSPRSEVTGRTLRQDYATLEDLRAAIPGLVLRHNLHGIDIDPRAAQIAALALWMRAQRAYGDFQIARSARPPIRRTNIVVAEPMPGEPELRQEFLATLDRPLAGLVEKVFQKMELAGEAGSLLRIEEDIREASRTLYGEHGDLFRESDEERWHEAEAALFAALSKYAHLASDDAAYRRRLFAEDAARGFAFIDLCRQRYDVALMNPPFGEAPRSTGNYIKRAYPDHRKNIAESFVARTSEMSSSTGAILDRSIFYRKTYKKTREMILRHANLTFADIGWDVMDDANVEASAFTMMTPTGSMDSWTTFFNIRHASERAAALQAHTTNQEWSRRQVKNEDLLAFPNAAFAYWVVPSLIRTFRHCSTMSEVLAKASNGMSACDSPRFLRLWWEVPREQNGWIPLAHGGSFSPYFRPMFFVVNWMNDGREVKNYIVQRYPYLNGNPGWVLKNEALFFQPGLSYGKRTPILNAQIMPPGCIFSDEGQSVFPMSEADTFVALRFLNSRAARYLINAYCGQHKHSGYLNRLPCPMFHETLATAMSADALAQYQLELGVTAVSDERCHFFASSLQGQDPLQTAENFWRDTLSSRADLLQKSLGIERDIELALGLSGADAAEYVEACGGEPRFSLPTTAPDERCDGPGPCIMLPVHDGGPSEDIEAGEDSDEDDSEQLNELAPYHYGVPGEWAIRSGSTVPSVLEGAMKDLVSTGLLSSHGEFLVNYITGIAFGRFSPSPTPSEIPYISTDQVLTCRLVDQNAPAALADDPHSHMDVASALSAAAERVWPECSSSWTLLQDMVDQDASDLRDWIRGRLFGHHLRRYSRSRRKAPIYWQLATPSASYSVWIYYHRLTRDTFYQVLNDFVVPKLRHEEAKLTELRQDAGPSPTTRQRKEIDDQETFVEELRAYREEVERVAPLWSPNLNDGVILNFAPLWRLVPQHREWQKECRECWNKLAAGDYDWAHLAMHLWPERVVPKCATDRSLAIAHDLEEVFWQEGPDGKWRQKSVPPETIAALVAERTSPAVRDARDQLLQAPEPLGRRGGRRAASTPRPPRAPRAPRPAAPEPQTAPTPRPKATADPQAREAILRHLSTTPAGASKSDLLAATALDESAWKPTIDHLLATNQVTRTGEKRGTRYHLAAPTRVS